MHLAATRVPKKDYIVQIHRMWLQKLSPFCTSLIFFSQLLSDRLLDILSKNDFDALKNEATANLPIKKLIDKI